MDENTDAAASFFTFSSWLISNLLAIAASYESNISVNILYTFCDSVEAEL